MTRIREFRRHALVVCAAVALLSGAMLVSEVGALLGAPLVSRPSAAAAPAGTPPVGGVTAQPPTGALDDELTLAPDPVPAFCPGDTATGGYRWQTFLSTSSNDPATFTYTTDGPVSVGGAGVTFPLVSSIGSLVVGVNTGADDGDGGQIVGIPSFDLAAYGDLLPDGEYNIGFACSLAGETVSFWVAPITITGGTYEAGTTTTTTTTTATTTVADGTTTSTTVADGSTTSTTVADGSTTSTSVAGGGSDSPVAPVTAGPGELFTVTYADCEENEAITFSFEKVDVTNTCTAGAALGFRRPQQTAGASASAEFTAPTEPGTYEGTAIGSVTQQTVTFSVTVTSATATTFPTLTDTTFPSANTPIGVGGSPTNSGTGSGGQLVATGSSTTSIVVWAILLLVFGRMAILFGRKPKVLPPAGT